jgi:hypothetical protein
VSAPDLLQNEEEHSAFVDLLRCEGVRSFLEIGSKYGGSLWRAAIALPTGSRVVSVDLEHMESLKACCQVLRGRGYDVHTILGNSQSPDIIAKVKALGPYDAVFIDADHRIPGVTADWETYGLMARIVAFHDISWWRAPEWMGTRFDVPQFWDRIKTEYRHQEFRFDPKHKDNGIGVLWRS